MGKRSAACAVRGRTDARFAIFFVFGGGQLFMEFLHCVGRWRGGEEKMNATV